MPELIKKRSRKAGLPPGSLIHIGDKKKEEVKITVIDYDEGSFQEKVIAEIQECFTFKDKPTVTWINVDGIHKVEIPEKLGECYGFHPLIIEDILNSDQRPKIEDFGDYIYIVLKMLNLDSRTNSIISEQVSLILGPNFVISFQEGHEGDVFNPVRERLRAGKGKIRKMGADYLAYSLIDSIVDNYFIILEKLGEKIESLEERLVTNPTGNVLREIHNLKREMLFLRKSVWPLREVISTMAKGESSLIHPSTGIYLRDIYDHTIHVVDTIETFRDMVSGMLDIYLSSMSNRMNAVMKVLTIIATIFMPLTFLAGVYGMNFKHMPELEWKFGYPLIVLVMLIVVLIMLYFFRKKKWI
ncbi:MAG: magnesium/cobalt transporter CorA [Thermodesulfovibrionales bacterium]|nr:magnesium/cobalt transporter CorA [Thermodesulfovibrionales bacterium]